MDSVKRALLDPVCGGSLNHRQRTADGRQGPAVLWRFVSVLVCGLWLVGPARAQSPVGVVIDPAVAGPSIGSNFSGLSFEISLVLAGRNGGHFFSPENEPLVRMFKTLGIESLRVGGNTAEKASVDVPANADIDSLFGFARATGTKVIYTLRLDGADPSAVAKIARYVLDHYKGDLTCFTVGNEPDKENMFSDYRAEFGRFVDVITSPGNAPEARFCGPSTTHMHAWWAGEFARTFAHDPRIVLITQHEYPARSGRNITDPAAGCDRLLSQDLIKVYEALYNEFVPVTKSNGLPYRLEECNSYSNGGAEGVSDAFAAALWGLDYLHWWAEHGAAGLNFHTGGYAPGDPPRGAMKYAVFWNSGDGLAARPLAYALKAFDLANKGRLTPAKMTLTDTINMTGYAVVATDKTLFVTLINKEHGPAGRNAEVILSAGGYHHAQAMFLTAPAGDVGARTDVTLGGASIGDDGTWKGAWAALAAPTGGGQFKLKVAAASAVVVKLTAE